ncbi:hypothetical protein PRIC2_003227 [Phytophthora ramorum]
MKIKETRGGVLESGASDTEDDEREETEAPTAVAAPVTQTGHAGNAVGGTVASGETRKLVNDGNPHEAEAMKVDE